MADKYTYADVIIDPNDPRVEIGAEYYRSDYPKRVLKHASDDNDFGTLEEIDNESPETPFIVRIGSALYTSPWACLIRKKEPAKKWVPFNLSKEEDRARLRGAWVRKKEAPFLEQEIAGLSTNVALVFLNDVVSVGVANLLEEYEFVDGSPCGKLVEEE